MAQAHSIRYMFDTKKRAHLNRVSESEKNEDLKNCSFPEKGIIIS